MSAPLQYGPSIAASQVAAPPEWALLQRRLIEVGEENAALMVEKHCAPGGMMYYADDIDDYYEKVDNWSVFYAMGGARRVFDDAMMIWNASTRTNGPRGNPVFGWMLPQLYNEYYCLGRQEESTWVPGRRMVNEWHHHSEGNMAFYGFGLADPEIPENVDRAPPLRGHVHRRRPGGPELGRRPPHHPLALPHQPRARLRGHPRERHGRAPRQPRPRVRGGVPLQGDGHQDHPAPATRPPGGGLVEEAGAGGRGAEALQPHGPRRRRGQQPGRLQPGGQRLPLHRRGAVQEVGPRLRRGVDRPHPQKRRHHPRQPSAPTASSASTGTASGGAA